MLDELRRMFQRGTESIDDLRRLFQPGDRPVDTDELLAPDIAYPRTDSDAEVLILTGNRDHLTGH